MQDIPQSVQEYLSTNDGLGRASVVEAHPDVRAVLERPETRQALLRYLASDQPWIPDSAGMAISTLDFLLSNAKPEEAIFVRPLVLHPQPELRLRAYNFLMAIAANDRAAQVTLFESMLLDGHDLVRTAGARNITRTGTQVELKEFLSRWLKVTAARGAADESRELIERLIPR